MLWQVKGRIPNIETRVRWTGSFVSRRSTVGFRDYNPGCLYRRKHARC